MEELGYSEADGRRQKPVMASVMNDGRSIMRTVDVSCENRHV